MLLKIRKKINILVLLVLCFVNPTPALFSGLININCSGCDTVVPRPGGPAGMSEVLLPDRHVVHGHHLRRDGQQTTTLPGGQRDRSAVQVTDDHSSRGNSEIDQLFR